MAMNNQYIGWKRDPNERATRQEHDEAALQRVRQAGDPFQFSMGRCLLASRRQPEERDPEMSRKITRPG